MTPLDRYDSTDVGVSSITPEDLLHPRRVNTTSKNLVSHPHLQHHRVRTNSWRDVDATHFARLSTANDGERDRVSRSLDVGTHRVVMEEMFASRLRRFYRGSPSTLVLQ
jgi:hypothetical protein